MNRRELIKEIEEVKGDLDELITGIGFGLNTPLVKKDIVDINDRLSRLYDELRWDWILLPKRGLREYVDGDDK